jgi:flagellar biosynthetic protein FlhB
MAEESDQEKTEPASARRLEKAREEGQVARSRELVTFLLLGTAMAGLWFTAGPLGGSLKDTVHRGMAFDRDIAFEPSRMLLHAGNLGLQALLAIAPLFAMMVLAALAGPMALGGWLFSPGSIAPKFSKLDPLAGIGRMFSTQSLADLVKALAKSLLIGGIAWKVISDDLASIMALMGEPVRRAVPHTLSLIAHSCVWMVAALFLVALVDVPYQLWSYHRKLRMSREDLRQENKESEGDPHLKARIRRQQQQVARRRMMSEIPKADVVITNPTHFAVALKYQDGQMRAPRVVAKGADLVAQRIREIAAENQVAILEAPALTRSLYKHADLGQEIPAGLYTAVAELLAWAYQLRRWQREGGLEPRKPTDLPVPEALQYSVEAA